MKHIIFLLVLFIPFMLIAQEKVEVNSATEIDQTNEWMLKISSNSEMRVKMLEMMIEETKGNKEEMIKLVNSALSDPEMRQMITSANNGSARNNNISFEPRGMEIDSVEISKMTNTKPVPKK